MEKPVLSNYDYHPEECGPGCSICEDQKAMYEQDLKNWERENQLVKVVDFDKFWMVAGGPNPPRVRHFDYESAHKEAKRLAEKHPGTAFYVVQAITKTFAEAPKAKSVGLLLDRS